MPATKEERIKALKELIQSPNIREFAKEEYRVKLQELQN